MKHQEVEQATMVEIDRQVVEVSQRFFPQVGSAFGHPKAQVIYDDAAHFVATTDSTYDVILADTSDPIGPAEVLFQRSFYQTVHDRLGEDGIFVPQTESPWLNQESIKKIYQNLRAVFPVVRMYLAHVPTYPGALWSFAFCSKRHDPLADFQAARCVQQGLRYYNADIHRGTFALPTYVQELVG
jgi:spermidine synthase